MKIKKKYVKLGVVALFIAVFAYLIIHFNIFDKSNILKILTPKGSPSTAEVYFVIALTILLVFFVPISWLSLAATIFFGYKGALLMTMAGLLSGSLSFLLARIFKEDVSRLVEKIYYRKERKLTLEEIYGKIKSYGFGYVVFIRSMPFIPFSILNYIFGISIISFKSFFLATLLSVSIGQSINVYFFYKALRIGEGPLDTLIAAAIKGLYFLVIILWQRKSKYSAKE
ncbi:MAG: TVP38/TMEM64 family protein [Tissierellia bacterium]|nr:TVP38/TMEM64 family protein [Tissierellia bacterium]